MQLKPEQIARLRRPFDAVGAFENKDQEEVTQILNGVMEYYLTLARIHIRNKNRKGNGNKSLHNK